MKIRLLPFRRLNVFPAMLFCVSGVAMTAPLSAGMTTAFAAPAAPASETVPPAPVPAKYISFAAKADGRHLLFAARDAYRDSPSLRVSAQWKETTSEGRTTSGSETILAQFRQEKLAITSETAGAAKTVRRAIANGGSPDSSLVITEYRETKPNPIRQFTRFPLDDTTSLARSLQMARFAPTTEAGDLLLTPDWRLKTAALVYVSRADSSTGNTAVIQTDLSDRNNRKKMTRRYLIDSKTNRLRRYEEWQAVQGTPRPATKKRPADNGMHLTYRREDYTESAAPVTAADFSQALPASYTEQTPPKNSLPPLPKLPAGADPKALALMKKWETAQERFFTLNAVADVRSDVIQRAEDSRPLRNGRGRGTVLCTIWRMRPGQARITINDIDAKTNQPINKPDSVVVADGQKVRINDYGNGRSDTSDQRDPAVVPLNRMRQVVRQNWDSGIGWIFDGPPAPAEFSQIALDATATAPTLVFSRTYDGNSGRGQKSQTRILWRVTLGPDNLPREILSRRDTNIIGGYERDQPPTFTTTVSLRRVAVDTEPLPETFFLPPEITRK